MVSDAGRQRPYRALRQYKKGTIMKTLLLAAALLGSVTGAQAQISARINIGQPNFYGTIDVGDYRPQLVYERPVIIERTQYVSEPVYLRVPPGHRKHWNKHCARYNACGRPVLFVQDSWYTNTYAPRYREQHGYSQPRAYVQQRGHDRNEYREERHERYERHDRHEERDDDKRGHGNGHGGGNGNGNGNGNGHGHGRGHDKD